MDLRDQLQDTFGTAQAITLYTVHDGEIDAGRFIRLDPPSRSRPIEGAQRAQHSCPS